MRMSGTKQVRLAQRSRKENLADQRLCSSSPLVTRHLPLACPAEALRRRVTAFLIDRAYQLEIDLTPCRISETALSNRRWIAVSANRISRSFFTAPHVDGYGYRVGKSDTPLRACQAARESNGNIRIITGRASRVALNSQVIICTTSFKCE
jgi:hypothetical protein